MGNIVRGSYGGFVYANSPESGTIRFLNTATIGTPNRPAGFDTQLAPTMGSGIVIAGAIALGPEALASKSVGGAILGGGFDAFGQLTDPKNEPYRPWQTVINAATGAVAFSWGGKHWMLDGILGVSAGTIGTAGTNAIYGRSDSVAWNAVLGGVFGGFGNYIGNRAEKATGALISTSASPNSGSSLPGFVNTGVSTAVGGIPSLFPYKMPPYPWQGGQQP